MTWMMFFLHIVDTVVMGGTLDPATSRASQAPTENEISDHSTTSQTSPPTTSCSKSTGIKIVLKDTIIAPSAIFVGTSLSQGRSRNSGRECSFNGFITDLDLQL